MYKRYKELMEEIQAWHRATFKNATYKGQMKKLLEEIGEYREAKPYDKLEEYADIIIVSAGIKNFSTIIGLLLRWVLYIGMDYNKLVAIEKKMKKNRARSWKEVSKGCYHH